jgi:hypothetical protein
MQNVTGKRGHRHGRVIEIVVTKHPSIGTLTCVFGYNISSELYCLKGHDPRPTSFIKQRKRPQDLERHKRLQTGHAGLLHL